MSNISGVENELHLNINYNLEHQRSLSKIKFWFSNNCLQFLKCAVLLSQFFMSKWYFFSLLMMKINRFKGSKQITTIKLNKLSFLCISLSWHLLLKRGVNPLTELGHWNECDFAIDISGFC
jgi:hypothetical protein